ncbi:MAG: tetratricopeptide repeat protein [Candidatus Zixiibacteriota bacterium]
MEKNREVPMDESGDRSDRKQHDDAVTESEVSARQQRPSTDDDDFEFVVTEAHAEGPDFVGTAGKKSTDDDLGLESPAEQMEHRATDTQADAPSPGGSKPIETHPIGESTPPPPGSGAYPVGEASGDPFDTAAPGAGANGVHKLSDEEVRSINERMYADSSYLSAEEKERLFKHEASAQSEDKPFGNTPIEPPKGGATGQQTSPVSETSPAPTPPTPQPESQPHQAASVEPTPPALQEPGTMPAETPNEPEASKGVSTEQPQVTTTGPAAPPQVSAQPVSGQPQAAAASVNATPAPPQPKTEPVAPAPTVAQTEPPKPTAPAPQPTQAAPTPQASVTASQPTAPAAPVTPAAVQSDPPAPVTPPPAPPQPTAAQQPVAPPAQEATAITQAQQPGSDALSKPAMARRQRGVAYFYKNFIELKGSQQLADNDHLTVNEREYVLKKKTLSPKAIITLAAPVFLILLFVIGAQFVGNAGSGEGQIIGLVVDKNGQPYLKTAVVKFPDLGQSFETNAQGFFRTGNLPAGNHRMEYIIDGVSVGTDYATVTSDEITTILLKPTGHELAQVTDAQTASSVQRVAERPISGGSPPADQRERESSRSQQRAGSREESSKIVLAANVDGARLAVDGRVLGAGNLTYSRLSPGRHSYSVSRDGFSTVSGSIELRAGKTSRLEVALTPLTREAKLATYEGDDFFRSGLALLREGQFELAIADLTEAINKQPSRAEAYTARAQAYNARKQTSEAYADYLRAGEIYQIQNDLNQSITAFSKAIELAPNETAPLLGRGNVFLNKGEHIAATADFESAVRLDERNAQAHFGLGRTRFEQGYYKKAIDHFKDAQTLEPNNPAVYQYLMLAYLGANDIKNVKKSYEKFTEVASGQQLAQLQSDSRYAAVMKIIDMGN